MKKKYWAILMIFSSVSLYSQTNTEILNDINTLKNDVKYLKNEIQSVKSDNIYLKKALEINKAINSQEFNDVEYTITKIESNKKDQTITITLLLNAKKSNVNASLTGFELIDLNGNTYEINYNKSSSVYPKLTANVPLKINITFDKVVEDLIFLKLFKFKSVTKLDASKKESYSALLEFRDLKVD